MRQVVAEKNERRRYCLEAVQLPVHPSERRNEPEPARLEKRPELFRVKPLLSVATDVEEPLGLPDRKDSGRQFCRS
jgi:hypothetical protein